MKKKKWSHSEELSGFSAIQIQLLGGKEDAKMTQKFQSLADFKGRDVHK